MSRKVSGKTVFGIGFNSGESPTQIGGKCLKEYSLWRSMLFRCTEKFWIKRPTYVGTTCSENFKSYEYFYEWCNKQVGFSNTDAGGIRWHLDKDLLFKGNRVYSEDTCVFVPQRINSLLIKVDAKRGGYPVGVSWCERTGKFPAYCRDSFSVAINLGRYYTAGEAFQAYKAFKEMTIKQVAKEYKEVLDERAYQALLNYTVEITD